MPKSRHRVIGHLEGVSWKLLMGIDQDRSELVPFLDWLADWMTSHRGRAESSSDESTAIARHA